MNWAVSRWNFYAPHYDRWVAFTPHRQRSITLARLQPGERVLISGCGTGLDLPLLPPGLSIDAADLSPGMLAQAAPRAAQCGASLQIMDAQRLAFPDESFDCVFLHLIVAIVPDP
ncbi:MAG: methyltransferase domain-containing protein, partial [Acidobacteria bacterium]|nr:methyltransferase domain-containing protein [Acidobacteriota bacterium]